MLKHDKYPRVLIRGCKDTFFDGEKALKRQEFLQENTSSKP
jgi:hypothetical protein